MKNLSFHYYVKDHLGNNRAVVGEDGHIEQTTHYYPFGNSFADAGTTPALQQYKYNGKELDRMHGLDWYDYGARNYDPVILLWDRPDPLADKYYPVSPYVYCADNPVNSIDTDGRKIKVCYLNKQGVEVGFVFTGIRGQTAIAYPRNQFVRDFLDAYMYNVKNGGGEKMQEAAINPKYTIEVRDVKLHPQYKTEYYNEGDAQIFWNSRKGLKTTNGGKQSPATRLEHEFDHAIDDLSNHSRHKTRQEQYDERYENKEERRVITGSEAKTAKANRESVRYDHYGKEYDVSDPTKTY